MDKEGNTAAHLACMKGYSFLLAQLSTIGANVNILNRDGETPLDLVLKEIEDGSLQANINQHKHGIMSNKEVIEGIVTVLENCGAVRGNELKKKEGETITGMIRTTQSTQAMTMQVFKKVKQQPRSFKDPDKDNDTDYKSDPDNNNSNHTITNTTPVKQPVEVFNPIINKNANTGTGDNDGLTWDTHDITWNKVQKNWREYAVTHNTIEYFNKQSFVYWLTVKRNDQNIYDVTIRCHQDIPDINARYYKNSTEKCSQFKAYVNLVRELRENGFSVPYYMLWHYRGNLQTAEKFLHIVSSYAPLNNINEQVFTWLRTGVLIELESDKNDQNNYFPCDPITVSEGNLKLTSEEQLWMMEEEEIQRAKEESLRMRATDTTSILKTLSNGDLKSLTAARSKDDISYLTMEEWEEELPDHVSDVDSDFEVKDEDESDFEQEYNSNESRILKFQ